MANKKAFHFWNTFTSVTKAGWGWLPRFEPQLVHDFILLGQKLEKLGFTCINGKVTVVDAIERKNA